MITTIDLTEYDNSKVPTAIIDGPNGSKVFDTDILLQLTEDDTRKHAELLRAYLEN